MKTVSRQDDPSPFAWIFGGLLGVLGIGAFAAGVLRRKASRTGQPGGGSQA